MTEELVTFETAKLAKEKGFDEECGHVWEYFVSDGEVYGPNAWPNPTITDWRKETPETREIFQHRPYMFNPNTRVKNSTLEHWLFARPTQDLLERWLREKYGLLVCALPWYKPIPKRETWTSFVMGKDQHMYAGDSIELDTYELAREAALQQALNLIKS